jgi:uncharacterized protein
MTRLTTFGRHATEIGTYVYRLIDPRSGHTFYVGKGRGDRVFAHAQNQLKGQETSQDDKDNEDYLSEKNKRITEIITDQLEVLYVIHRHSMETVAKELIHEVRSSRENEQAVLTSISDKIAYEVEAALIDAYEGLSNIANGHGNSERGCQHAEQLQSKYQKEPLIARHRLIAFSIGNGHRNAKGDLDKAVRLAWRANLEKARRQNYVLAHDSGQVIDVFEVSEDDWLEATPENFCDEISWEKYESTGSTLKGRIGIRKGGLKRAPEDIRKQYVKHILPPSRTTNPVRYFGQEITLENPK